MYDENGYWIDEPTQQYQDSGYTDPYEEGYQGGYSAGDPMQAVMQTDPQVGSYLQYIQQATGMTSQQLGQWISGLGGVAAVVAGIRSGQLTSQAIQNSIPQQTAANTATARQQATLNNPNINTPYGSQKVTFDPATGQPTINQTLDPAEQGILEQQRGLSQQALGTASQLGGQLGSTYSQQFGAGIPGVERLGANPFGAIQGSLDFGGAPAMPTADRAVLEQTVQKRIASELPYMQSQFQQQQQALESQLANQGIAPGTEAYKSAMQNFTDTRDRALQNLYNTSYTAGMSDMNTMFGEQLSSRQQGVGEATTQGNFANTAQGQGAQQLLAKTAANNQGQGQQFGQATTSYLMPLNVYNAFRTGSQVNNPQFGNYQPTTVAPTNITTPTIAAQNANQATTGNAINLLTKFATGFATPPVPGG